MARRGSVVKSTEPPTLSGQRTASSNRTVPVRDTPSCDSSTALSFPRSHQWPRPDSDASTGLQLPDAEPLHQEAECPEQKCGMPSRTLISPLKPREDLASVDSGGAGVGRLMLQLPSWCRSTSYGRRQSLFYHFPPDPNHSHHPERH